MFGVNFFNEMPRPFKTQYRCYSVSMMPGSERDGLEQGGKIIMPPSALDHLTRLNIVYPMLFKLTNNATNRTTHCGVLEFVADEGKIYIPYWMMQNLTLEEGGLITVESASLPVATFARFQPHSCDFLDLTNQKAVLESRLRNFACLSKGDVIAIFYNKKTYELSVLETKPADAVSVIECDLNVDFAPPVGYKEESRPGKSSQSSGPGDQAGEEEPEAMDVTDLLPKSFAPFSGAGNRLDGKKKKSLSESEPVKPTNCEYVRGIPDYDYEVGTLSFIRWKPKKSSDDNDDANNDFEAFTGEGKSLRSTAKIRK